MSSGTPSADRKDLEDEEVTSKVWIGVLPVREHVGTPHSFVVMSKDCGFLEGKLVSGCPGYERGV